MTTSKTAVKDYLDNMFMDLTLSETVVNISVPPVNITPTPYYPVDSIEFGSRMVPCIDPFKLMGMTAHTSESQVSESQNWLAYLVMLSLCKALPIGRVQQYCFAQCQTLNNKISLNHYD